MSTGFNCKFFEHPAGQWFYILQDWDCPVGAFDWTTHATVRGPFLSREAARDDLNRYEANPGGYSVIAATETAKQPDAYAALAQRATPRRNGW